MAMKLARQCDGRSIRPRPFNSNSFKMLPFDIRHPSRETRHSSTQAGRKIRKNAESATHKFFSFERCLSEGARCASLSNRAFGFILRRTALAYPERCFGGIVVSTHVENAAGFGWFDTNVLIKL